MNQIIRQKHTTAIITGNQAAAEAERFARVKVVCFFPIGPSDEVGEHLVRMIHRGQLDARIIDLENERSAVNAQITATQGGVRASFATNSEGLVFAYQPLFWAAYARVPIVVAVAHRAMEPPTIIVTDDHDTIIFRDAHWIQFYCENPQDVFDTMLQARWVAERHDILLPAFVTWPGWEVSHSSAPVDLPTQEQVDAFLPPFQLPPGQDILTMDLAEFYGQPREGTTGFEPTYMEQRYHVDYTLNIRVKTAIEEAYREYLRIFGRGYGGLIEKYQTDDADIILIAMSNIAAVARVAADAMRRKDFRVGVIKIRVLRPFPSEAIADAAKHARVLIALDRNPVAVLYHELRSALYDYPSKPVTLGRIVALGGRDFTHMDCMEIAAEGLSALKDQYSVPRLDWRLRIAKG